MSSKDSASEAAAETGRQTAAFPLLPALSLAVALLASGLAGWSYLQLQDLQALPSRLQGDESQLVELNRRIEILVEDVEKQRLESRQLREQLEASVQSLNDVPLRLEQVEESVASIPDINPQSRRDWLKSEALYYLRVANAQALLSGNAELTANALQLADEKLREAGDPAMAKVRARITEEIAALQAMPEVDRTGISFRLQSLLASADNWPLRNLAPDEFVPETIEPAADLSPWDRFIATIKAVLANIITVKETDEAPILQLSASEKALIIEGVKAELQVARLAFASNNTELFAQSLERARTQTEQYFDSESAAVKAALRTLGEIQAIELPGELPDITGSLSLMLNTLNADSAAPEGDAA